MLVFRYGNNASAPVDCPRNELSEPVYFVDRRSKFVAPSSKRIADPVSVGVLYTLVTPPTGAAHSHST